jgi:hypothetical protein
MSNEDLRDSLEIPYCNRGFQNRVTIKDVLHKREVKFTLFLVIVLKNYPRVSAKLKNKEVFKCLNHQIKLLF